MARPTALTGGLAMRRYTAHNSAIMHVDTSATDEALAARVQAGEREVFGELVERYEEKLLRYGRKFLSTPEDIEDIVQDAFENAFRNINSFDASRRFSPWMYRIAHNAFVNTLRKRSRYPLSFIDFDTFLAHHDSEVAPPDRGREETEMRELIESGLAALNSKSREILILYYLEEFSYQEIADILQVPSGTVGVRLKRAREQLKLVLHTTDAL